MPDLDPFNLKHHQRDCKKCADGRIHTEPIGDTKIKHWCDTCSYSYLFTRKPQHEIEMPPPTWPDDPPAAAEDEALEQLLATEPAPPPAAPNAIAFDQDEEEPADAEPQTEAIETEPPAEPAAVPIEEPTPISSKETDMAFTQLSDLTSNEQARWRNAGKLNLDKFKKAGCPTPSQWRELQGEPTRRTKKKTTTKKSSTPAPAAAAKPTPTPPAPAAPAPVEAPAPDKSAASSSQVSLSVKMVSVHFEGDPAAARELLNQFINALR